MAQPLEGRLKGTSLLAFVAGTAVGTALAVGLAALRAPSRELTSDAGSARSAFVAAPTASVPVGVAAQAAEATTTTAALAPDEPAISSTDTPADEPPTAAPAPESPAPVPLSPGRASRPSPPVRARAPARPRTAEVRASAPRAPGTHAGSAPAPTKAELARQISQLRSRQPALATTLTVELNELDAEDEASLRSLASRVAAASGR